MLIARPASARHASGAEDLHVAREDDELDPLARRPAPAARRRAPRRWHRCLEAGGTARRSRRRAPRGPVASTRRRRPRRRWRRCASGTAGRSGSGPRGRRRRGCVAGATGVVELPAHRELVGDRRDRGRATPRAPAPPSSAKWTRMKKTASSGSPNCWLSRMLPPPLRDRPARRRRRSRADPGRTGSGSAHRGACTAASGRRQAPPRLGRQLAVRRPATSRTTQIGVCSRAWPSGLSAKSRSTKRRSTPGLAPSTAQPASFASMIATGASIAAAIVRAAPSGVLRAERGRLVVGRDRVARSGRRSPSPAVRRRGRRRRGRRTAS